MLLVHHLLENGCRVHTRHIVVLEGRHEGHRTRGHHQVFGIDISHLLRHDVLDGQPRTLKDVPHRIVEQDAVVVVAGQRTGNVEASHTAVFFLTLEKEELVGLHVELPADARIVVDHQIVHPEGIQLLTAGQTRRTGTHDGHRRLVDLQRGIGMPRGSGANLLLAFVDPAHLPHPVDRSDANAAHLAVDKHLACSTLADAAFQAAVAAFKAVAVHRHAGLMQSRGYGVALASLNGFAFE